jgi:hypothetical protein
VVGERPRSKSNWCVAIREPGRTIVSLFVRQVKEVVGQFAYSASSTHQKQDRIDEQPQQGDSDGENHFCLPARRNKPSHDSKPLA